MKFVTKATPQYPPHLRQVATLPWEMKNANFLQIFGTYGNANKLHFLASTFVIRPQISTFSVFKIASFSLY